MDWPVTVAVLGSVATIGGIWLKAVSNRRSEILPSNPNEALTQVMHTFALTAQKQEALMEKIVEQNTATQSMLKTILDRQWEIYKIVQPNRINNRIGS